MKQHLIVPRKTFFKTLQLMIASLLFSFYSIAQDKKVDININTKSDNGGGFFMQPWVWVVGGAVFILLLVALLRNNRSRS